MMNRDDFPTLFDHFETASKEVIEGMLSKEEKVRNQTIAGICDRMGEACGERPVTRPEQEQQFAYLAIAYGLHEAADQHRREGNIAAAEDLFGTAQLFIGYAVGELEAISMGIIHAAETMH